MAIKHNLLYPVGQADLSQETPVAEATPAAGAGPQVSGDPTSVNAAPETTVCKTCHRMLPTTDFPPSRQSRTGRMYICAECITKNVQLGRKQMGAHIYDPNRRTALNPADGSPSIRYRRTRVTKVLKEILFRLIKDTKGTQVTAEAERFVDGLGWHLLADRRPEGSPEPTVSIKGIDSSGDADKPMPKLAPPAVPEFIDGRKNPEHLRQRLSNASQWIAEMINHGGRIPQSARQLVDVIKTEAKAYGINLGESAEQVSGDIDESRMCEVQGGAFVKLAAQMRILPDMTPEQKALKKKLRAIYLGMARLWAYARIHGLAGWTWVGRSQDRGEVFDWQWFHMQDWVNRQTNKHTYTIIPPGSGKTDLILGTEAIVPMGQNPNIRVGVVIGDESKVRDWLKYIRGYMVHPRFKALFPDIKVDTRQSDDQSQFTLIRDRQMKDPTVGCYGVLQIGEGYRYDVLIMDDASTRQVMEQPAYRAKVNNAISSTWMQRLEPDGKSCGINTRWHHGDYAGNLIRKVRDEALKCKIFEVKCEELKDTEGRSVPGESHWPARFPRDLIRQMWILDPAGFARTHWNKPTGGLGQVVNRLCYYDEAAYTEPLCQRWVSIDPAGTESNEESDETSIGFFNLYDEENGRPLLVLRDAWSVRVVAERIIDKVHPLVSGSSGRPKADRVLLERKGPAYKDSLCYRRFTSELPAEMFESFYPPGNRSKEDRLNWCASLFENGTVLFPGVWRTGPDNNRYMIITPHLQWLEDQILQFGSQERDDGVDMVTQMVWHHHHRFTKAFEIGRVAWPQKIEAPKWTSEQRRLREHFERQFRLVTGEEEDMSDADYFEKQGLLVG
jgi:hypothetical protein